MSKPRFRILKKIASGTYSDVFKILDLETNNILALKSIKKQYRQFQVFHSIFRWNLEISKQVSHPNIIKNHFFVHKNNHYYFTVMDYVDGYNLYDLIHLGPELSRDAKLYMTLEIARGLEACHEKNIIHRNLSITNVLVSREGQILFGNFGLAAIEKPDPQDFQLEDKYVSILAPEQIHHLDVSNKTDIWALGVIMFELLVGKNPFSSNNPNLTINRICDEKLVLPPEIDPNIAVIIEKCLEKDASLRYPSISVLGKLVEIPLKDDSTKINGCKEEIINSMNEIDDNLTSSKILAEPQHPQDSHTRHTPEKQLERMAHDEVGEDKHESRQDSDEILNLLSDETESKSESSPVTPMEHEDKIEKPTADIDPGSTVITPYVKRKKTYQSLFDQEISSIHQKLPGKRTDKLLFMVLIMLGFLLVALVLAGDYFNVAHWPVNIINKNPLVSHQGILLVPTPGTNIPSSIVPKTPTPLPTNVNMVLYTPTESPRYTSTPALTATLIIPTSYPALKNKDIMLNVKKEFMDGNLSSASRLLLSYLENGMVAGRKYRYILDRMQTLERSISSAKNDLREKRCKSALVQLSIIENAYLALCKKLDPMYKSPGILIVNGLNVNKERNRISHLVMFIILVRDYKISKLYVNNNPVQVIPTEKAYIAYATVPKKGRCSLVMSNNRGILKKHYLYNVQVRRKNNLPGAWLVNDHVTPILFSSNAGKQILDTKTQVFLPLIKKLSVYCDKWGEFELDDQLLYENTRMVSIIRVVYIP